MIMSNTSANTNGKTNKHFHNCNNIDSSSKVSSPVNGHSHQSTTTSTYNHMINPLKFTSSYSNQDLSSSPLSHYNNTSSSNVQHHPEQYQNSNLNGGRSRSVLSQINESVIPENTNFKQSATLQYQNRNKMASNGAGGGSGNVISQKVISIGMPNKSLSRDSDQSPSPKLCEIKSKPFFETYA